MSFKVKGCNIGIEYSFILVLSIAALFGADDILKMLLFSSAHELSHFAALILLGGRADSITLSFYGAALKYSKPLTIKRELCVIISGPITNLILFFFLRDDINLILFLLNILPVFPLDGGRVLELFSYKASLIVSKILIVLLFLLSLYLIVKFKSFSMFLITMYLIFYTVNY